MKPYIVLLLCALAGSMAVAGGQSGAADVMLRAAIARETVDGDLAGAITQYEAILKRFPNDRAVAARALLQIGGCYEKLGRTDPGARRAYERIVREYSDITTVLTAASARLTALGSPLGQPARARTPFPVRVFDDELGDVTVTPSKSGRLVAYTRPRPGTEHQVVSHHAVYVRDLATGRERLVYDTNDDRVGVSVRWFQSDDRELLLEVVALDVTRLEESITLRVLTLSTGRVRDYTEIAADEPMQWWSPDDQWRAYWAPAEPGSSTPGSANNTPLREVRIGRPGTTPRTVGHSDGDPDFVWSPDSTRVAFHATDRSRGVDELRIVTVATGESRVLDTVPLKVTSLRTNNMDWFLWTAGDEILFRNEIPKVGQNYYLIPAGGGPARLICEGRGAFGGNICGPWAPDGSTMLWQEASSARLFVRDLQTMTDRPLTRSSGTEVPLWWSPDSRLVAFKSNRDGQWGVYVAPIDQTRVADPLRIEQFDVEPIGTVGRGSSWWRPDGGLMLHVNLSERNIYRLNMDRLTGRAIGSVERLTQDAAWNDSAAVSPDGRTIAYWLERGWRTGGLALMGANGGRERLVLEHTAPSVGSSAARLHWIANDELVFYEFAPATGEQAGFRVFNTTTRTITRRFGREITAESWEYAPTRAEIVICDCEAGMLRARAVREDTLEDQSSQGGSDRLITKLQDVPMRTAVSHDGRKLAYVVPKFGVLLNEPDKFEMAMAMAIVIGFTAEMRVVNLDGTDDQLLLRVEKARLAASLGQMPGPVSWSPDGRFLIYLDLSNRHHVMEVATRASWPLFEAPTPGDPASWEGVRWSPDGTFLVLTAASERSAWRWWPGVTYQAVIDAMAASAR